jgi:hypothetical protein
LRPLATRGAVSAAHYAVNAALHFRPRNVGLKKLEGVLTCMLGGPSVMPAPADDDTCRERLQTRLHPV